MREALVVQGGWQGHTPKEASEAVAEALEARDFKVEVADTLDAFKDVEKLRRVHLIVPCWTMGKIEKEQLDPLMKAVSEGTGLGGWHGGMCDSFRTECGYQHMTGGQWVAHPGGGEVTYVVNIIDHDHPITRGMADFEVTSEQYYLHVDPANKVLAVTPFPIAPGPHTPNGPVEMPVVWTRLWGAQPRCGGRDARHLDEAVGQGSSILHLARPRRRDRAPAGGARDDSARARLGGAGGVGPQRETSPRNQLSGWALRLSHAPSSVALCALGVPW